MTFKKRINGRDEGKGELVLHIKVEVVELERIKLTRPLQPTPHLRLRLEAQSYVSHVHVAFVDLILLGVGVLHWTQGALRLLSHPHF